MINRLSALAACAAMALAGCATDTRNVQGPLQPQTTEGRCTVKKFFLLAFTAVRTEMAVEQPGQPCTFTVLNPDLQAFPTAVLVTQPALHGQVTAGLTNGGRSPVASYAPQPGFTGTDRFTITIEPNDHAIAVSVRVGPGG